MVKNKDKIKRIVKLLKQSYKKENFSFHKTCDPFRILISCILSQRTREENTDKAYKNLFLKYDIPKGIAAAPIKTIERLIKPSGFYRVKARYIKAVSHYVAKYGFPKTERELKSLSGIGQKTADIVLAYAFHKPVIAVDTHVFRVSKRLGIANGNIKQVKKELEEFIPKLYKREFNHLMVNFGRHTCLPRSPKCKTCKLSRFCSYYKNVYHEA